MMRTLLPPFFVQHVSALTPLPQNLHRIIITKTGLRYRMRISMRFLKTVSADFSDTNNKKMASQNIISGF